MGSVVMRKSFGALENVGIFVLIAIVTVSWASTTVLTIKLFEQIRLALIASLIPLQFVLLFRQPRNIRGIVIGILMISALVLYSLLLLRIIIIKLIHV